MLMDQSVRYSPFINNVDHEVNEICGDEFIQAEKACIY